MTCNTYSNIGFKFSNIKIAAEDLNKNILTMDQFNQLENDPLYYVDKDELTISMSLLNEFIVENTNFINSTFPSLSERLDQSILPLRELGDIFILNQINPDDFNSVFSIINITSTQNTPLTENDNIINYLNIINSYYGNYTASITGGFCSLYNNKLFSVLGLISSGASLLSELKNFSLSGILSKIFSINDLLLKLVDKIIEKVKVVIQNMTKSISGISNQIVFNQFYKKMKQIESIYSPENVITYKNSIEQLITNISSQFKDITSDIISFILFRMCKIANIIEDLFHAPITDMSKTINAFKGETLKLTSMSSVNRQAAINAGAIRIDNQTAMNYRTVAAQSMNQTSNRSIVPEHYITIPADDFERSLVATLSESGNQFVEFAQSVLRMEIDYPSAYPANNIKGAGWRKVAPDVWLRLFRVADRLGKKFIVNSGYRNENKNAHSPGAVSNSLHMSGLAVDISMNGLDRDLFIKYASQEGFGGIGTYPTFIHVDIGNRRRWGNLNSTSLDIHDRDGFRKG